MTTLPSDAVEQQVFDFPTSQHPIPDYPQHMRITPAIAADWLENRNFAKNRKLSEQIAAKWARSMSEGRWMSTHQGIAFDYDGWLIDGQHRLRAIVISGVAVEMFVATNCDPETFAVLDSGHKRQAAQLLNVRNATVIAAAARVLAGVLPAAGAPSNYPVYVNLETQEILAIVEQWPELVDLAPPVTRCYAACQISQPLHMAILAQASRSTHADKIESWAKGIVEGACLEPTDPRLLLRNRFMRDFRTLNSPAKRKTSYGLIVKAWNAHALGKAMGVLKVADHDGIVRVID